MALAYLVDPENQFMTKAGTINVAGKLRVFDAATDDAVVTYSDFNLTENPEVIILDNNGRAVIIADSDRAYRLEVYDRYDTLLWTTTPLWCLAAGGGIDVIRTDLVSTDGSIEIAKTQVGSTTTYDLGIAPSDSPEFLEWSTGFRGNMTYGSNKVPNYSAGTMSFDQYGVMVYKDRYYHITNKFYIKPLGTGTNYETFEVALMLRNPADGSAISVEIRKWDIDTSLTDEVQVEMSFDLTPNHDGELYWEFYNSLPKFQATDAWIQIHRVYSGINAVPDTCATKQWVSSNYQPLSGMSSYVAYSAIEHNGDGAISGIHGSAIVGELDTDTVSAIASSYAESAASSKLDSSASSEFYLTSNPSGFITGVDLSPYQLTADMTAYARNSSLSSLIDYSALEYDGSGNISGISGSAIGGQGGTDSATVSAIASAYAESAASGKLDNSASSTWYPMTGNPSGFLTAHQDISDKLDVSAFTSYSANLDSALGDAFDNIHSALDDKMDASASGDFYPMTGNPSGFLTNDDISSKLDVSAFNDYSASVDSALDDKLDVTAYDSAKYPSVYWPYGMAQTTGQLLLQESRYPKYVQALVSGTGETASAGVIPPTPSSNLTSVQILAAASGSLPDVAWTSLDSLVSGKVDESALSSYMPYSSLGYSGSVITSIDGSAIGGQGDQGHEYSGIYPVNVDNTADTISVDNIPLCLESPLSAYMSGDSAIINIDLTEYATTAYVESSVSGKADSSALDDKLDKTAEVVTATAVSVYAGTAYLHSVNGNPISAVRAGQAANASLATSAWYDGTGRYISALPDSAAVSAIASAYAESAASGKQDSLTFGYDADNAISSINNSALAGGGGAEYSGVAPIVVDNDEHKISAQTKPLAVDDTMTSYDSGGFTVLGVQTAMLFPASASSMLQPSGDYAYNSSLSSYQPTSAMTSYMFGSAIQAVADSSMATATGVLYILTGGV